MVMNILLRCEIGKTLTSTNDEGYVSSLLVCPLATLWKNIYSWYFRYRTAVIFGLLRIIIISQIYFHFRAVMPRQSHGAETKRGGGIRRCGGLRSRICSCCEIWFMKIKHMLLPYITPPPPPPSKKYIEINTNIYIYIYSNLSASNPLLKVTFVSRDRLY